MERRMARAGRRDFSEVLRGGQGFIYTHSRATAADADEFCCCGSCDNREFCWGINQEKGTGGAGRGRGLFPEAR